MEELIVIGAVGAAGVVALAVAAPLVGIVNPELGKTISDSGKNLTKNGLKLGMETYEKFQNSLTETNKAWDNLLAEVKLERDSVRQAQHSSSQGNNP